MRINTNAEWRLFGICLCANTLLMLVVSSNGDEAGALYSVSCRLFMFLIYGMFILTLFQDHFLLKKSKELLFCVAMFASALISYLVHPTGTFFQWLIIVLSYLEIPVLAILMERLSFEVDILRSKIFKSLVLLIAFFLIYHAFLLPVYDVFTGALTMGYSNSNRTAIYLLMITCLCLSVGKLERKRIWKYSMLVVSGLLTVAMPLTQSRAAMFCIIATWIFWLFGDKLVKLFTRKTVLLLVIIPIVFVMVYLNLIEKGATWLSSTIIYGKSLDSGRKYIYWTCFEELQGNWLLGNYAFSPLENKHNTMLSVLTAFGIIGLIAFTAFYYVYFSKTLWKVTNVSGSIFPFFCMLAIYFSGMAEGAVFTSGIMYAGMFGMIMLLANENSTGKREENDNAKTNGY